MGVNGLGKLLGVFQVGNARLAPDHVGVGSIGQSAADGLFDAWLDMKEPFRGALAGQEGHVVGVDVAGQQVGGVGVGAGDQEGGYA